MTQQTTVFLPCSLSVGADCPFLTWNSGVLSLNSIWPLRPGFQNICALPFSAPQIFVTALFSLRWAFFPVCGHASVSLGREDKDKHVPFSLHNLSESFFSCLGARTEVPVYPEREREGGLAVGLPRQQGTVQAWWWKKRGSGLIGITGDARGHLCALRYSTLPFEGGKRKRRFFFFKPN